MRIPGIEPEVRLAGRGSRERLCGIGGGGGDGAAGTGVAGAHFGAADKQADEKPAMNSIEKSSIHSTTATANSPNVDPQ